MPLRVVGLPQEEVAVSLPGPGWLQDTTPKGCWSQKNSMFTVLVWIYHHQNCPKWMQHEQAWARKVIWLHWFLLECPKWLRVTQCRAAQHSGTFKLNLSRTLCFHLFLLLTLKALQLLRNSWFVKLKWGVIYTTPPHFTQNLNEVAAGWS